ncbi:thermonuclease family protein [Photobacterium makurazakiensis]|uniref:thermonuclease family protein n=1 Tax=Photobacterium makurazakiensis TaxID=2910234 RepID=UPI003D14F6E5
MKKLITLISICVAACSATAASINDKNFGSLKVSRVDSIYDGDTFRVTIDQVNPIIGERIPIRVAGIDTPEIRGKCKKEKKLAQQAKQFTVSAIRKSQNIELHNVKRGKYFRIIADVKLNGYDLGHALIEKGFAVPYDGGKKIDWCQ